VPADPDGGPTGTPVFRQDALMDLHSDTDALSVEVRTWPAQPPSLGNCSVQLVVTSERSDAPVPDLSVDVLPWMPAMGHGTSRVPLVSETAPGVYQLDNVFLFMPGTWQVRTTFSGAIDDHVTPTFELH